jgi:hypothetical protein
LVAYFHSQSKATEEQYKRVWGPFSSFIDKTAEQILAEYNASDERAIKRQYAQYIMAWIVSLSEKGLTPIDRCIDELNESYNIVSQNSQRFTQGEKARIIDYCRQTRCAPRYLLGFGKCGLLVALKHQCPNNSLPIL